MWASVVHVAIISSKLSGGVCVQSEVGSTNEDNSLDLAIICASNDAMNLEMKALSSFEMSMGVDF
jgi:hypothetical protein